MKNKLYNFETMLWFLIFNTNIPVNFYSSLNFYCTSFSTDHHCFKFVYGFYTVFFFFLETKYLRDKILYTAPSIEFTEKNYLNFDENNVVTN